MTKEELEAALTAETDISGTCEEITAHRLAIKAAHNWLMLLKMPKGHSLYRHEFADDETWSILDEQRENNIATADKPQDALKAMLKGK